MDCQSPCCRGAACPHSVVQVWGCTWAARRLVKRELRAHTPWCKWRASNLCNSQVKGALIDANWSQGGDSNSNNQSVCNNSVKLVAGQMSVRGQREEERMAPLQWPDARAHHCSRKAYPAAPPRDAHPTALPCACFGRYAVGPCTLVLLRTL
eukprot:365555-Chlamydomonas_euryale.AAC.17